MRPDHQKVAVATTSPTAADAARETAELGGNAVDCAIAAAMCAINTQPGVCALAGSAYVTIWAPDGSPVTIDGNVAAVSYTHLRAHETGVEISYAVFC